MPRPSRRLFRFGLGTILLILTIFCIWIFCIWLSQNFPPIYVAARLNVSVASPTDRQAYAIVVRSPLVVSAALRDGSLQQLPILEREPDPQSWLLQNLKVGYPSDDGVMEIGISGKPQEYAQLAQIVDTIVAAYLGFINKQNPQEARRVTIIQAADRR